MNICLKIQCRYVHVQQSFKHPVIKVLKLGTYYMFLLLYAANLKKATFYA